MSRARLLADAIVVFHLGYMLFLVVGLAAIVVGVVFRRGWARNPWFRWVHLAMIGVVVVEAILGVPCPLTVWESALRKQAGQQAYAGDFIGYWAHRLLFFSAPPWVFTVAYCAFGGAVLLTFLLAPPRRSNVT